MVDKLADLSVMDNQLDKNLRSGKAMHKHSRKENRIRKEDRKHTHKARKSKLQTRLKKNVIPDSDDDVQEHHEKGCKAAKSGPNPRRPTHLCTHKLDVACGCGGYRLSAR